MSDLNAEDELPSAGDGEPFTVGYGKPPKHTQFKPKNPGGPGRPKGSKNLKTIVNEAGAEKVPVKLKGKVKKVAKKELAIRQLYNKASSGDLKAIEKTIALEERYGPQDDLDDFTPKRLQPDLDTLRNYLAWQDRLNGDENEEEGQNEQEDGDDDEGEGGDE